MAGLFIMNSKKFLKKIAGTYDLSKFQILLASSDIKTNGEYANVAVVKKLMPSKKEMNNLFDLGVETFSKEYVKKLNKPESKMILASMIKTVAEHDKNVILLCSAKEDDIDYLEIIETYIENVYDLEVLGVKDLKKNPEILNEPISNKEDVLGIVNDILSKISSSESDVITDTDKIKTMITRIPETVGLKPLRKLLKENGFTGKEVKTLSTKQIIKKSIKLCVRDESNLDFILKKIAKATK